ncbi:FkbM family methyltransferase [Algoriella sp.]|uniref:FkbM family methyltransferase n=1 Tax=Algoriella sp. TaxID=1872434 RepID=UPI001B28BD65|nr:FkbM family methyltransferase [Algoriella sp.]MBO6212328.1 FkbM family methyltransferase [Algoriella sp.]
MKTSKKIHIYKKTVKAIDEQFIGSAKELFKFKLAFYSHYLSKTTGVKNLFSFAKAKFRYQNVVLSTRENTIDFWACLESYEPDFTYFLRTVLSQEKGNFIDVGGHIGRFTTLMAKNDWQVVTFEPIKSNYNLLMNNLNDNDCNQNAVVYNIGLGDKAVNQNIYFDRKELGEASMINNSSANDSENIKIEVFDELMKGYQFNDLTVVKIDVEGFEENVINGMKDFLTTEKPLMVLELWSGNSEHVITYLKSLGYKRLHIFWFIEEKHGKYMDEMFNLYKRSNQNYQYS